MDIASKSKSMRVNIAWSLIIKACAVLVNFLFVPLTINYINTERYGIWLTLSSVISWFNILDLGFGNGLRNKYAEAISRKDEEEQRKLVQTTIFSLCIIATFLCIFGILTHKFIHWDAVIGLSSIYRYELQSLYLFIVILFSLQFVFQIVNPIFYALQKSNLVSLNIFLGNIFGIIGVVAWQLISKNTLFSLGIIVMSGNLFSSIIFFGYYLSFVKHNVFRNFTLPSLVSIKDIFSLGIKFFVINVAYVVQYQTSNFLIIKLFSPEKVTEFNIAFKLLSVVSVIFNIIIGPVWSTVTSAYMDNEYKWIESLVKKLLFVWLFMTLSCVIILLFSDLIYKIWVRDSVSIPYIISVGAALIVCSNCFSSIFIQILNGMSKINIQFWLSILVALIFLPLAYFLSITLAMGVFGISLAVAISNINGIIVAPIQLRNIIVQMKKKEFN